MKNIIQSLDREQIYNSVQRRVKNQVGDEVELQVLLGVTGLVWDRVRLRVWNEINLNY